MPFEKAENGPEMSGPLQAARSVVVASLALAVVAAACKSNHATSDGGGPASGTGGRTAGAAGTGGGATASGGGAGGGATGAIGGMAGTGGAAAGAGGTAGSAIAGAGTGGSAGGSSGTTGSGGAAAGSGGAAAGSSGAAGAAPPPVCNPTCGAHQTCLLQGSAPTCACVTGYQVSGSACVWGTVPADPGFQNMPAGAWTLGQGASIEATAAGYLDPGELHIPGTAACPGGGATRQTISMPAVAAAEPLAITLAANADCITRQGPNCRAFDLQAVINGGVIALQGASPYIVHTGCLGERAYSGTFDLIVRPSAAELCSTQFTDAVVDHVQIAPSSTCPPPGTLPNGDFDGTPSRWLTWSLGSDGFTPVAEIAPTMGSGGSAAAHLGLRGSCETALAHELISPPQSMAGLAVQVRFKGTAGASARVFVDNVTMAVLAGTNGQASANVCLLESNKGMTQDLMLGLGGVTSLPSDVTCGPVTQDFVFDDLKVVSDASCPPTAYLADGGFERTDPAVAWDSALQSGGVLVAQTGDVIGVDTTAANVHGGARALKIVNSDGCALRKAAFPATVPASAGGAGPALQFFHKAPALAKSNLTVTAGGASSGNLPASPAYTQAQLCLNPAMAGQTVSVELTLAGNAACALQLSETAWFDDFTITTSPACPAQ